jgi:hypothetical protein
MDSDDNDKKKDQVSGSKKKYIPNPKSKKVYTQGIYHPVNPTKYMGTKLPFYRSSWERTVCRFLDNNPSVIKWGSELVKIPYEDTVRTDEYGRPKRRFYYTDFVVILKRGEELINQIIEVKPYRETIDPKKLSEFDGRSKTGKPKKKKKSTILYEHQTYETNMCKWEAARGYCKAQEIATNMIWEFLIITEKHL